jgi:DNA-binding XRE family transcriptional regulator
MRPTSAAAPAVLSDAVAPFTPKTIARRVREARVHADLTQAELAEAAGVTDETISRIERGAYEPA